MRWAGLDTSQVAVLAVIVICIVLLLGATRRRVRRSQAGGNPSTREQYAQLSQSSTLTRDIEAVMLELDQLSRQIHGRLDAKIARIEALLGEADKRIHELSRQHRAAAGRPTLDVTLDQQRPDDLPATATPQPAPAAHADIYQLADDGLTAVDIARTLGQTTGEVELILSLRKAKGRRAGGLVASSPDPLE